MNDLRNPPLETERKMTELKPCPFCGGSASIERYGDHRRSTIYQCDNCSCSLETGEEWGHGGDWNRRALSLPLEETGWKPIETAPKDRRILIKAVTFAWSSDICQHVATGDKWVEARWGKDLSGKETWLEWCGDDKTHTTDSLTPIGWAPLPAAPSSTSGGGE